MVLVLVVFPTFNYVQGRLKKINIVYVSLPGMFRVVTDKTVFATPEAQMGFHPDAGASYYLSRLPDFFSLIL
ncbi:hypothetical protein CsSME_00048956 [Camellia sinensis var. sinensis]